MQLNYYKIKNDIKEYLSDLYSVIRVTAGFLFIIFLFSLIIG